jgi:hypothetical protein
MSAATRSMLMGFDQVVVPIALAGVISEWKANHGHSQWRPLVR